MTARQTFNKGDMIIRKGAPAEKAFMILSGSVEIFLEKDGKTITLATLSTGSIFGESALFATHEYGANARAKENTTAMIITPEDFKEKLETCDPLLKELIYMLIERQRQTNKALLEAETREFMDLVFLENVASV